MVGIRVTEKSSMTRRASISITGTRVPEHDGFRWSSSRRRPAGLVHTKRFSKSVERSQVFPLMRLLTPSVCGARGSGGWRNGASSALGGNWWKTGTVRPIPTDTIIVVKNKRPGGLNG
jgi:hypothetical protein